jgi:hypothetical protein
MRRRQPSEPWVARQQDDLGPILVAVEEADRAAVRRGQDVAHPFLDSRVVEFFAGLPREQRVRGDWDQVALRNALAGIVPDAIRMRRMSHRTVDGAAPFVGISGIRQRRGDLNGERLVDLGWVNGSALAPDGTVMGLDEASRWRVAALNRWLSWLDRRSAGFGADRVLRLHPDVVVDISAQPGTKRNFVGP